MQTMQNNTNSYFMCKFTYGKILIESLGWNPLINRYGKPLFIRDCSDSECRGAHKLSDVKIHYNNSSFNSTSKVKYDWIQLYLVLIKSLEIARITVDTTNLIDIIQLWKTNSLTLSEEYQDFATAFERTTHYCPDQLKVNTMIMNRKTFELNDICLGTGLNCRNGVNKPCELLCSMDFMTGKCDCITKDEYNAKLSRLKTELSNISDQKKIDKKTQEITNLQEYGRTIHYTDYGMIPFEKQYNDYIQRKEEESRKNISHLSTLDDMIRITQLKKPILSLGKLGCKK
jgi:hypothetical protein